MSVGRFICVAGQGATVPATGELAGTDVTSQTEQCLKNLQAILEAGGSDLQHVLRCGVFLLDMREFAEMNAVYTRRRDLVCADTAAASLWQASTASCTVF